MLLYYITDRKRLGDTPNQQRINLLLRIESAARANIDCIELREEDLSTRELELLAHDTLKRVQENSPSTKLLIYRRTDVALATGADGVHLASDDISPADTRAVSASGSRFLIAQSCHSISDVRMAESQGADLAVLSRIFNDSVSNIAPLSISALTAIAANHAQPDNRVEAGDNRHHIRVLVSGGVTVENADLCRNAGAAGIAGIRLFQSNDIGKTIERLRSSKISLPSAASI